MPGYAFHLETLKQASSKLSSSDPATAAMLATPAAALGAFGPDLLLYTPPSRQLASDLADGKILELVKNLATLSTAQKAELSELFHKPWGAAYSALFSLLVEPTWPDLHTVTSFIAEAGVIAQSEDSSKLQGFFGQVPAVQAALTSLASAFPAGIKKLVEAIGMLIALGPWMEDTGAGGLAGLLLDPTDIRACRTYELLRWHGSGQFAEALMEKAKTKEQKEFALGWLTHVATSVTAEPFVNNIVGGPYRTHWWRNRLVQNFVDSWTWGRFETTPSASMAGDDPSPPYEEWAALCSANIQERFNVGNLPGAAPGAVPTAVTAMASGNLGSMTQSFPAEIHSLLQEAIDATYPASVQPNPAGSLSADTFAEAYVGAFGVFWFLTSGEGPVANNTIGPPPSDCGTKPPSWINSSSAPAPQQQGVTSGSEVCEVILAILAILAFLTGNTAAGIALVVAALEEQPSIEWEKVRCDVYWITNEMLQIENGLRDILVLTALAFPPPILLGGLDPSTGTTQPATDFTNLPGDSEPTSFPNNAPPSGGEPLTRTNTLSNQDESGYPEALDKQVLSRADFDFFRYPLPAALAARNQPPTSGVPIEQAPTKDLIPGDKYPDFVLDGSGLIGAGMMDAGTFPTRGEAFGDAVSNALLLISRAAKGVPDYNLDGDRGYGWQGWHPAASPQPASGTVDPIKD